MHGCLLTIGDIARIAGVPPHRIRYVAESRGIEPAQRAGRARLWTEKDLARFKVEFTRISSRGGAL